MRKTTTHSILLAIMSLWTGISASAYDFRSEDGLCYNILSEEDRTVEVTHKYRSNLTEQIDYVSGDLNIPPKVIHNSKTYTVTSIGNEAFLCCIRLTSITLPNYLTSIGYKAFKNCSVTSITLSNSLTKIDGEAFYGCSGLTSLTLPNSLTSIDEYAFSGCSGLTSLTLPNSLTSIGKGAFSGCSGLTNINVEVGNTVYSSADGVLYNKDATELIRCPQGKSSVLKLPETLISIAKGAFWGCSRLTSLTLLNSLTEIGEEAFSRCSGLTSLTLPNSLTSIGEYAFAGCSALEKIINLRRDPIECDPKFPGNVQINAVLYIPLGTMAEYGKVDPWRNFWIIKEMDPSGIEEIETADDADFRISVERGILTIDGMSSSAVVSIHDMQGRCIYSGNGRCFDNLTPGIYMLRVGNKTVKFVI